MAHEVAVLDWHDPNATVKLRRYRLSDTGIAARLESFAIRDFLRERREKSNDFRFRFLYKVALEDAVLSPDHLRLACTYRGVNTFENAYEAIYIYDLRSGRKINAIQAEGKDSLIVWSAWKNADTLLYNERYYPPGKFGDDLSLKRKSYSLQTGQTKILKTIEGDKAGDADPNDYEKRANRAGENFQYVLDPAVKRQMADPDKPIRPFRRENEVVEPGGSYITAYQIGHYKGTSEGAVSEDGKYAVGRTNLGAMDGTLSLYYLLIEGKKRLADLRWPRDANIKRFKFAGNILLVVVENDGQTTIEVWSMHPVKQIGSIDGDFLVD